MDAVSRVLRNTDLQATVEKRCLLGGATAMDVAAYDARRAPFHVLLEGECRMLVGDVELRLSAGDAVVIPSGRAHRVITAGPGRLAPTRETSGRSLALTLSANERPAVIDLFCGHFSFGPGVGALLFDSLPDPLHVSLGETEDGEAFLRGISELMRTEAEHDGPGTSAILSALSTALLALLLRTGSSTMAAAPLWTAAQDPGIVRTIEAVLDEPGAAWTIDQFSAKAMMSRATFQRRFRRETGMSVGDFLTRSRLAAAARLLVSGDLPVSAVAAAVGYQSESAFTRAFRAALGTSPARFRRDTNRGRGRREAGDAEPSAPSI